MPVWVSEGGGGGVLSKQNLIQPSFAPLYRCGMEEHFLLPPFGSVLCTTLLTRWEGCMCDCDCGRWWYNFCIWLLKQLVCVWERIIVDSLKWNELTETLTIQIRRGLPAAAARTYKKDVDVTTSTWMVHWWMQRHRVQRSAIELPGNGSQFRKDCSFLVKLIGKCLHKKVIHKLICLDVLLTVAARAGSVQKAQVTCECYNAIYK